MGFLIRISRGKSVAWSNSYVGAIEVSSILYRCGAGGEGDCVCIIKKGMLCW